MICPCGARLQKLNTVDGPALQCTGCGRYELRITNEKETKKNDIKKS